MGFSVVQFVHPGFEYRGGSYLGNRSDRSGVMPWKPGRSSHNRKFLVSSGSLAESARSAPRDAVLTFWGEWEGPSVFWKLDGSPRPPFPSVVHAPFRPAVRPSSPIQNTDPMVFGDAFIYSNCMQPTYRALRSLTPGSIVLFGRHSRTAGRPSFSLDTCFVVDGVERIAPAPLDAQPAGADLLHDAVLGPLETEGAEDLLNVYFGRPWSDEAGPFSFFPARDATAGVRPFARPELEPVGALGRVVSPANMQGIKVTLDLSEEHRDQVWAAVVQQVIDQGSALGIRAAAPPVVASVDSAVTAEGPMPLA